MKFKYKLLSALALAMCIAGCAQSEPPRLAGTRVVVPRPAYFPQMSPDGKYVAYSSVDGLRLQVRKLDNDSVIKVDSVGAPGYDARFGGDGLLYYVTMERRYNNLIYRTAHCFDVTTGRGKIVLAPQHGAVRLCPTSDGMAIIGENKSYIATKRRYVYTEGSHLVICDGSHRSTMSPAGQCAGYIWASLSPDGSKVVFDAVGKGLYVCDLNGKVLAKLGYYMMPCWLDNDYIVAMLSPANNTTVKKQQLIAIPANGRGAKVALTTPDEDATYPMVALNGELLYVGKDVEAVAATVSREALFKDANSTAPFGVTRSGSYHVDVD